MTPAFLRYNLPMCGRYVLELKDIFHQRFGVPAQIMEFKSHFNVAPSNNMPVVTFDGKKRHLEIMRWGLIPHWAKDKKIGYKMINARLETLSEKPSFKKSLHSQRCIVPASGFYEWQKTQAGKRPYYIRPKDNDYFSFAGLYDIWKDEKDQEIHSYTIITGLANSLVKKLHDRMPVILDKEQEAQWLSSPPDKIDVFTDKLKPYTTNAMEMYPVSKAVNSVKNDSEKLISPSEYPELR